MDWEKELFYNPRRHSFPDFFGRNAFFALKLLESFPDTGDEFDFSRYLMKR